MASDAGSVRATGIDESIRSSRLCSTTARSIVGAYNKVEDWPTAWMRSGKSLRKHNDCSWLRDSSGLIRNVCSDDVRVAPLAGLQNVQALSTLSAHLPGQLLSVTKISHCESIWRLEVPGSHPFSCHHSSCFPPRSAGDANRNMRDGLIAATPSDSLRFLAPDQTAADDAFARPCCWHHVASAKHFCSESNPRTTMLAPMRFTQHIRS